MADPVSMSLDDYIKSQKKTGKMSFGRGGGGGRRGGPKGGGNRNSGQGSSGAQKTFRGRRGRPSFNNVQRRRGNGNFSGSRNRQFAAPNASGFPRGNRLSGGGMNQGPNRNNLKRRNRNRQMRRSRNTVTQQQGSSGQLAGAGNFRYFTGNAGAAGGGVASGVINPKRNQVRRMRPKKVSNVVVNRQNFVVPNRNTKRAVQKLAKKRVQRAKLLVSRLKGAAGTGKKKLIAPSGRVALGKNGFVTVRNTNAKRMERQLVQMKIARAQKARNRLMSPPQRTVSFSSPGPSSSGGRRRNRSARRGPSVGGARNSLDWNTSIVRTMTNDLADDMSSSHLNPEIQRRIAFIQNRPKADRVPVMPDFRAPVSTSRMKLSDRFRLINDR